MYTTVHDLTDTVFRFLFRTFVILVTQGPIVGRVNLTSLSGGRNTFTVTSNCESVITFITLHVGSNTRVRRSVDTL